MNTSGFKTLSPGRDLEPAKTLRPRRVALYARALFAALAAIVVVSGCKGLSTSGERAARRDLSSVAALYRPEQRKPTLPQLSADSPFSNFVAFAVLNSPRVEAAYADWAASVERITVDRSMPDPKLTFESDIADEVMTVMPGLMQDIPGPGKLKARAAVSAAGSRGKYFAFESAVLSAAFEVRNACYELHAIDERLRINHENLSIATDLEQIARTQNQVGKGTLQDVLRAQIELDRVANDIVNLQDSRGPTLQSLKAALGLHPGDADPPVPLVLDPEEHLPSSDELLRIGFERNPDLKAMEADVRAAEAGIGVAYKERVPDFSLGLEADVKASPTVFRPLAQMTLPIWRDKIAAEIAQAKASEMAAQARLTSGQIALATDFAEKSFAYRQASRDLELLRNQLIPKARQSLELARAGYLSGTIDFFNLNDAQRTLLDFQVAEVEARTRRRVVLSQLSLLIAGLPPRGAPLLPEASTATR